MLSEMDCGASCTVWAAMFELKWFFRRACCDKYLDGVIADVVFHSDGHASMGARGRGLASIPGCRGLIGHRRALCLPFLGSCMNLKFDRDCIR